MIVIDDCSTDRSAEIVRSFEDPRIRLYKNIRSLNESGSTNFGFTLSRGKYVYIVHDDDYISKDLLEIFYQAAQESQADVVIMNACEVMQYSDSESKIQKRAAMNPAPRFFSDDLVDRIRDEYIGLKIYWEPWTRFVRRDFIMRCGIYFPENIWSGDRIFFFGILCQAKKIQVIDVCGYVYREHPAQTSKIDEDKRIRRAILSLPRIIKYLREIETSPHTIQTLDQMQWRQIEINVMLSFFYMSIVPSYATNSPDKISDLLQELVVLPEMLDPNLMLILINTLASKLAFERR